MGETGQLYFGKAYAPVGFTSAAVSQFDGSADPVVRELLQNSLDAAARAGRPAEVRFSVTSVAVADIPGWQEYQEAFAAAKSERGQRAAAPSPDETATVRRIDEMMSRSEVPVLMCVDNGCGVDPRRMTALLTVGNTDKGSGGAGSFGLGHHAAFGASDLRYVLYGSRYSSDAGNGTVSSGHALLASRHSPDGAMMSPEGYWRRSGWRGPEWADGAEFPRDLPGMLCSELSPDTTGTAIAVLGFNDFHRDRKDVPATDQIMAAACMNFSAAVMQGCLTVTVVGPEGDSEVTDAVTTRRVLQGLSGQRRSPKAGRISGAAAYAAHETLRCGSRLLGMPDGVEVRWRLLDLSSGEKPRVHVFRKGMWISSRADGLMARDFPESRPFDAVVSLSDGVLESVVRASEGPEHRGVERQRLDEAQRAQLRSGLREVADALREAVGVRDDADEYVPGSFATVDGSQVRKAEPVRKPRRRQTGAGGAARKTGGKSSRRTASPRSGTAPAYGRSVRYDPASGTALVDLRFFEKVPARTCLGVRAYLPSGSDATCDSPEPDEWLLLESVRDVADAANRSVAEDPAGDMELVIAAGDLDQRIEVVVADPSACARSVGNGMLDVDIVRRKASARRGA